MPGPWPVNDVEGYVLWFDGELGWRVRQDNGNLVEWFYLVVRLYRFAVHQNAARIGSKLDAVARYLMHAVDQVFVDADHAVPFFHSHVEMLVHLSVATEFCLLPVSFALE